MSKDKEKSFLAPVKVVSKEELQKLYPEKTESPMSKDSFYRPNGKCFWFPYKAGTKIDRINYYAAATGSPRYAMAAAHANFNGHYIRLWFNECRQYWILEYTWAGRQVITRGDFDNCLAIAKREQEKNGCFGALIVSGVAPEKEQACLDAGMEPWTKELESKAWDNVATWAHKEVPNAFWYEKHLGVPAISFLANSDTEAEYKKKIDEALAIRRPSLGIGGPNHE